MCLEQSRTHTHYTSATFCPIHVCERETTLKCVAVCCSVLHIVLQHIVWCVAVCCSVLQCVAVCERETLIQCVAVYSIACCSALYSVLQCVAVCCSVNRGTTRSHATRLTNVSHDYTAREMSDWLADVWHASCMCDTTQLYVTRLIRVRHDDLNVNRLLMCDMPHLYVCLYHMHLYGWFIIWTSMTDSYKSVVSRLNPKTKQTDPSIVNHGDHQQDMTHSHQSVWLIYHMNQMTNSYAPVMSRLNIEPNPSTVNHGDDLWPPTDSTMGWLWLVGSIKL